MSVSFNPFERIFEYTFSASQQSIVAQSLLINESSPSHSHTPHSVGLPWTIDQPVAETSTWQHTTLTTDIHAPGGIRTHNPSKQATSHSHLRPRDRWNDLYTLQV